MSGHPARRLAEPVSESCRAEAHEEAGARHRQHEVRRQTGERAARNPKSRGCCLDESVPCLHHWIGLDCSCGRRCPSGGPGCAAEYAASFQSAAAPVGIASRHHASRRGAHGQTGSHSDRRSTRIGYARLCFSRFCLSRFQRSCCNRSLFLGSQNHHARRIRTRRFNTHRKWAQFLGPCARACNHSQADHSEDGRNGHPPDLSTPPPSVLRAVYGQLLYQRRNRRRRYNGRRGSVGAPGRD